MTSVLSPNKRQVVYVRRNKASMWPNVQDKINLQTNRDIYKIPTTCNDDKYSNKILSLDHNGEQAVKQMEVFGEYKIKGVD